MKKIRIENKEHTELLSGIKPTDEQIAILLSELQIAQMELEMQNDELSVSAQLLETERAKFAGFFNLAPVGYFILDHLGIINEANRAGTDMLAANKIDILDQRFQSFIAADNWEHFYAFLHKMQTIDGKQSHEMKISSKTGKEIYTLMEGIAISNVFSDKIRYYITVIDISERRLAQQKLLDTTQRLEMTLKASATGTWSIESGNNKVFFDDFSYSLLGISLWSFDGSIKGFLEIIHPEDRNSVKQSLVNAFNSFNEIDIEFRIIDKTGKIKIISAKGHEVKNEVTANYFAGIIMDVTERKRLEREARDLHLEKQKLVLSATFNAQEKERYKISSALHDSVCQILYGIRLNLQSIKLSKNLEFKNIDELLDQAIRETRELSYELTPSVLRDFGFKAGVREMAQRLSTPGFQIKTILKNSVDLLHPDIQLYVFRMMQELISNSINHAMATEAVIKVYLENNYVVLVITDNGKGFNMEIEQALSKGSGIRGIKNRVFLLNGTMDLETSKRGTGITIKFKSDLEVSSLSAY